MNGGFKCFRVTIEDRDLTYNGKIVTSPCLIARVAISSHDGSCGYVGELRVDVGDINVARKLESVLEEKL